MTTMQENTNVQVGLAVVTNQMKDLEKRFDKFEMEIKKTIKEGFDGLDTKYVTKEKVESVSKDVADVQAEVKTIKGWLALVGTTVVLAVLGAVLKLVLK